MQSERIKKIKLVRRGAIAAIAVLIFVTLVFFAIKLQKIQETGRVLTVNDTTINLEIATTSQEKSKGLCCRNSLPKDSGMLFVYEQPGDYGFWMKDTLIPLDMYWISGEKEIVHIEHSVQPSSYPRSYHSPLPAQYILETNAGYAKRHSIDVGDSVTF